MKVQNMFGNSGIEVCNVPNKMSARDMGEVSQMGIGVGRIDSNLGNIT